MGYSKQPTGVDVAQRAGVSKSAVSRAFTGGSVSADARQRIFDAARELRYRPSQAARSLKTNRSRLIGVAVTHLDNQFYPEVIERIADSIAERGSRIVLFVTHGEAELEPVIDELLGFSLDGIILASGSFAVEVGLECQHAAVPVVMFNNVDEADRVPGVSCDNIAGGRAVARHFIDHGHVRTAVISGVDGSSTSAERVEGFREVMLGAGMPEPEVVCGHFTPEGAMAAMEHLLRGTAPPTAVFCVNDHMALAAIETCRSIGVEPGRDIAIAGFDNVAIAEWPSFSLTTYSQPVAEMVESSVARLFADIDGITSIAATRRLQGELIVRGSTDFRLD